MCVHPPTIPTYAATRHDPFNGTEVSDSSECAQPTGLHHVTKCTIFLSLRCIHQHLSELSHSSCSIEGRTTQTNLSCEFMVSLRTDVGFVKMSLRFSWLVTLPTVRGRCCAPSALPTYATVCASSVQDHVALSLTSHMTSQ